MRYLFISLCLISFMSCRFLGMGERVNGNGKIISQQRNTGSFQSVEVSGSVTVKVRQAATTAVNLETDENLMQYIEVFTSGDKLVIRSREGYNLDPSNEIIAYVSAPVFRAIDVSGACDIIGEGTVRGTESLEMSVSGSGNIDMMVDVPQVSTSVSGSGNVVLHGRAGSFESSVSGSGSIRCFDLATDQTKISISGSGDAEVNASKLLDVRVSGDGSVQYKGTPQVTQDISGSGSVKKVG